MKTVLVFMFENFVSLLVDCQIWFAIEKMLKQKEVILASTTMEPEKIVEICSKKKIIFSDLRQVAAYYRKHMSKAHVETTN